MFKVIVFILMFANTAIASNTYFHDSDGNYLGRVSSDLIIYNKDGKPVSDLNKNQTVGTYLLNYLSRPTQHVKNGYMIRVDKNGSVYNKDDIKIGYVRHNGTIYLLNGDKAGALFSNGVIYGIQGDVLSNKVFCYFFFKR